MYIAKRIFHKINWTMWYLFLSSVRLFHFSGLQLRRHRVDQMPRTVHQSWAYPDITTSRFGKLVWWKSLAEAGVRLPFNHNMRIITRTYSYSYSYSTYSYPTFPYSNFCQFFKVLTRALERGPELRGMEGGQNLPPPPRQLSSYEG